MTDTQAARLTRADLTVVRKAYAILVLLGAEWGSTATGKPDPSILTPERVAETVAELLDLARQDAAENPIHGAIVTSGGLIVSGDSETGYELSVHIGNFG